MKIAVISDIHGNYEAFLSVVEDIEKSGVDTVISLGDNIGYGADSQRVTQLIKARNIISILGNHEMAVLDQKVKSWFKNDAGKAIELAINSLSADSLAFISSLKISLSFHGCFFVHGFPPNSFRIYLSQVDDQTLLKSFDMIKAPICFMGHTHKLSLIHPEGTNIIKENLDIGKKTLKKNLKYFINAGSVGQPRDGSANAKYVIWDPARYELETRSVSYDVKTAAEKIEAAGIPAKYARALEGKS